MNWRKRWRNFNWCFNYANDARGDAILIDVLIMLMQLLEIFLTVVCLFFQATRKRNEVIVGMFTNCFKAGAKNYVLTTKEMYYPSFGINTDWMV